MNQEQFPKNQYKVAYCPDCGNHTAIKTKDLAAAHWLEICPNFCNAIILTEEISILEILKEAAVEHNSDSAESVRRYKGH